jgi:hypothetical protein
LRISKEISSDDSKSEGIFGMECRYFLEDFLEFAMNTTNYNAISGQYRSLRILHGKQLVWFHYGHCSPDHEQELKDILSLRMFLFLQAWVILISLAGSHHTETRTHIFDDILCLVVEYRLDRCPPMLKEFGLTRARAARVANEEDVLRVNKKALETTNSSQGRRNNEQNSIVLT